MKFLDKVSLVLFSFISLLLAMLTSFFIFGWIKIQNITYCLTQIQTNNVLSNIILAVSVIILVLAVKNIYFMPSGKSKKESGEGILLENQDGKLLISKETIENLVNSVAKGFESTQNVKTEVCINNENKIDINVKLLVLPNTAIKELSANLQTRIKQIVKNTADLEINKINIVVKNVAQEKEKIGE